MTKSTFAQARVLRLMAITLAGCAAGAQSRVDYFTARAEDLADTSPQAAAFGRQEAARAFADAQGYRTRAAALLAGAEALEARVA